eukprot:CAMPEP_0168720482 /NCGR_PEP_ID=MMETSP0724-20121128/1584_1 /TAXON_ID=265536 /ORGANISM="Amphiprora sp., Strain CCMP467" /LENGTH=68 /DNA_ID=CAMNT_0008767083 /DNA_START=30 /DNA_END=233 /DNA_ORIENTATION=-
MANIARHKEAAWKEGTLMAGNVTARSLWGPHDDPPASDSGTSTNNGMQNSNSFESLWAHYASPCPNQQ